MAQHTTTHEMRWVQWHMLGFVVAVVMAILVIAAGFQARLTPFQIWISLLVLLLVISLTLSRAFTHRFLGILIDDRNKYSLSRLQMLLWTIMILSAFLAAVLSNIQLNLAVTVTVAGDAPVVVIIPSGASVLDALAEAGVIVEDSETGTIHSFSDLDLTQIDTSEPLRDGQNICIPRRDASEFCPPNLEGVSISASPLSVQIPTEVWLLLGISTTSLVASPLIHGQKSDTITRNQSETDAKLSDLFQREEIGNSRLLDLGKIQLFYVTLVVIGGYAIAVAFLFLRTSTNFIVSLPALDGGVVAMLGVSHAGYLSNKAVSGGTKLPEPTGTAQPENDQGGVG